MISKTEGVVGQYDPSYVTLDLYDASEKQPEIE